MKDIQMCLPCAAGKGIGVIYAGDTPPTTFLNHQFHPLHYWQLKIKSAYSEEKASQTKFFVICWKQSEAIIVTPVHYVSCIDACFGIKCQKRLLNVFLT